MSAKVVRFGIAFAAAVVLPVLLAQSGLFVRLGAHPWWGVQTALIGAPIGASLAMLPWLDGKRFILGSAVLGLSAAAAMYGKSQFAASYAEDAFAGALWYYGWIGIALGDALIVAALVLFVFPKRVA